MPAATEAPSVEMAIAPTDVLPSAVNADSARAIGTPTVEESLPKEAGTESVLQDQPQVKNEALVPVLWQIALLAVGFISGLIMFLLRQSAKHKWK